MAAKKKPAAKKRGKQRSAISGEYGSGKAATAKLARRIRDAIREHGLSLEAITAELSAATTVRETDREVLSRGWTLMRGGRQVFSMSKQPVLYPSRTQAEIGGRRWYGLDCEAVRVAVVRLP